MLNYKRQRFWVVIASVIIAIGFGIALLLNQSGSEPDLSFLNPNSMLSTIGDQEQIEIKSTNYGNTFVSGIELAKWLDRAENDWKRKNVSSRYEFSPSITINVQVGNEIRFFESELTLAMTIYQNEYRYYTILEEDYSAIAAMAGSGYPHVQSITFTEHENGNDNASVTITDDKTIMRMAVLMQKGEKHRPSLFFDSTQNDIPPVSDYIWIEMNGDKTYHSYFLYSDDEKNYYIDEPYDHINKIDSNTVEEIITTFTDAGNNKEQIENSEQTHSNVLIFAEYLYTNPVASFNPDGPGYLYMIKENSFSVIDKKTAEAQAVSPLEWNEQNITDSEWEAMFNSATSIPDKSRMRYNSKTIDILSDKYRLFDMDGEIWVALMNEDKIWCLYSLKPSY